MYEYCNCIEASLFISISPYPTLRVNIDHATEMDSLSLLLKLVEQKTSGIIFPHFEGHNVIAQGQAGFAVLSVG